LAFFLLLAGCGGDDSEDGGPPEPASDREAAMAAAEEAFAEAEAEGQDLGSGPCIAEELPGLSDWVADVAHDPRQPVDDRPENQCRRFRDREASHFVELTSDGDLIQAR
jgi:hypothetical protein